MTGGKKDDHRDDNHPHRSAERPRGRRSAMLLDRWQRRSPTGPRRQRAMWADGRFDSLIPTRPGLGTRRRCTDGKSSPASYLARRRSWQDATEPQPDIVLEEP
jgi:hypothetical protein